MCKTMKTSKTLEQFFGALYGGREEGGGVSRAIGGEARSLREWQHGEGWVEVGDIVKSKGVVE